MNFRAIKKKKRIKKREILNSAVHTCFPLKIYSNDFKQFDTLESEIYILVTWESLHLDGEIQAGRNLRMIPLAQNFQSFRSEKFFFNKLFIKRNDKANR